MNDYREVRLTLRPCIEVATDVLAALLADAGYESFVPDAEGLTAYIPDSKYGADALREAIGAFPMPGVEITFTDTFVEGRDWNAEWERNYFQPIVVGGECVIHSTFHKDVPKARYDIVIDPKMAFGTGHHATTEQMIGRILSIDIAGRRVMDMGTGTGILAILCAMRGAASVDAVEIDEFAYVNTLENLALNGHPEINVQLGDASLLPEEPAYDIFLANINRNVILADLPRYARSLVVGGLMALSGFYAEDFPLITDAASSHGLALLRYTEINRWVCLTYRKHDRL